MRAFAQSLALALALVTGGCARKLPGPLECRAFALESLGLPPETPASLLARDARLAAIAEDRTQTCLTEPWDYELLGCLQRGGGQQRCLRAFEVRQLGGPAYVE